MDTYIIKNVEALWPKINQPYRFDAKESKSVSCNALEPNAEYSIQFRMEKDTAQALHKAMSTAYKNNKKEKWAEKLANPFTKEDEGTFTFKSKLPGAFKNSPTTKPLQVDSKGNKLPDDFLLTTGSTVNIAVQFVPWDMGGKQNISLRLRGVQVVKYIPIEERNPFDNVEGFTITESDNPFGEVSDDVEEPKKVAKNSAHPPAEKDSTNLGDIVDDWDDD